MGKMTNLHKDVSGICAIRATVGDDVRMAERVEDDHMWCMVAFSKQAGKYVALRLSHQDY